MGIFCIVKTESMHPAGEPANSLPPPHRTRCAGVRRGTPILNCSGRNEFALQKFSALLRICAQSASRLAPGPIAVCRDFFNHEVTGPRKGRSPFWGVEASSSLVAPSQAAYRSPRRFRRGSFTPLLRLSQGKTSLPLGPHLSSKIPIRKDNVIKLRCKSPDLYLNYFCTL